MNVALYLLRRYPKDAVRRGQARELMRWVEDQFVYWRKPCRADGHAVLCGPDRGFNPWARPGSPGRDFSEWVDVPGVAEKYTWSVMENSLTASMHRVRRVRKPLPVTSDARSDELLEGSVPVTGVRP